MGMFLVPEGTKVKVIKDGQEWYSNNFKDHVTKETNVFDKSELTIDPTGISKVACTPNQKVIGGEWAKNGWYGFLKNGWYMLVPENKVQYG